jgi:heme/copper-type cytochrome/quinol oxidase subunit 2
MRRSDRLVIATLTGGIGLAAAAFAVFSFYDPIQAAFYATESSALGLPVQWQFNFQHPFSEVERDLYRFHNFLLAIRVAICALVTILVAVATWLFRASRHPVPSRITHNTPLEVTWTLAPVMVLMTIAVWSFSLFTSGALDRREIREGIQLPPFPRSP